MNREGVDEYADDDDPGFEIYVVNEENFVASCKELAEINNFPARAIRPDTKDMQAAREKYRKTFQEQHQPKVDDSAVVLKKPNADKKKHIDPDDELAAAQSID